MRTWPVADQRKPIVVAVAVGALLLGAVLLLVPFSAPGSAQHSNAVASLLHGCPQDEGEAVRDGNSTVGAQERCVRRAGLQTVAGAVAIATAVAAIAPLTIRRRVPERS